MQREEFIRTLLAAAAFLKTPLEALASQSLKDTYKMAKTWLRRKLGPGSEGEKALDLALQKPDSVVRKALLVEETDDAGLESDADMPRLGQALAALLPVVARQNVRVIGRGNQVQVAGRDLITTTRHVRRAIITPGEGHLTAAQRRQVSALIAEVADRLAGEDGRPRFGAVHAMLQHRFGVASYLVLPSARFAEVVSFLQRQRAIHRSRLRRRTPAAYQADYLRVIHAHRTALGWVKPQLYGFAEKELALQKPLTSLLELGPLQLKSLAGLVRRAAAKAAP